MKKPTAVEFTFTKAGKTTHVISGTVVDRPELNEWALEIPWTDGFYSVIGKLGSDGRFHGSHFRAGAPDDVHVSATWEKVGDAYLGTWIEDTEEYAFRFTFDE